MGVSLLVRVSVSMRDSQHRTESAEDGTIPAGPRRIAGGHPNHIIHLHGRRRPPCRDTKQPREAHNTPITDHRSSETPVTRSFSSTHAPNLMNQTSTRFTMWLILRSSFRSWIYPPIFPSVTDVDVQRLRCRRGQPCCFPRPGACELLAWRKRL